MTTIQHNNNLQIFSFLKDEKLADVTLTAEKKMIKAHKLILAASSKYFEVRKIKSKAMCNDFNCIFSEGIVYTSRRR